MSVLTTMLAALGAFVAGAMLGGRVWRPDARRLDTVEDWTRRGYNVWGVEGDQLWLSGSRCSVRAATFREMVDAIIAEPLPPYDPFAP